MAGAFGCWFFCEEKGRYPVDADQKNNPNRVNLETKVVQPGQDNTAAGALDDNNSETAALFDATVHRVEDEAEKEKILEEINAVKAELADKTAVLNELQQRYLRLQADFDNYRKRTRREQNEFLKMAAADLISNLLPIIDNLERALAAAAKAEKETLIAGLEMVFRQLKEILAAEGLAPVKAVGQPFDPELHEAVDREETTEQEKANLVLEEYRQGYTFKGRLLRPAMVKVAVAVVAEKQKEETENGE